MTFPTRVCEPGRWYSTRLLLGIVFRSVGQVHSVITIMVYSISNALSRKACFPGR